MFAKGLREWAVRDQGWTWDDSQQALPESISRTARLACSMLVNKIVFYEAMRKVYQGLAALIVPTTINTGEQLRTRFGEIFAKAMKIDYQTVFTEELVDTVPFVADEAVEAELLRQELKALSKRNLWESTFEKRADLVAKLGIKIVPSEDLKSRKITCRLNLAEVNEKREQADFAKVTLAGAEVSIGSTVIDFDLIFSLSF